MVDINKFFLAVYYLDIFMDNHAVRFWRFHLVALVALRIAAKIEEKDFSVVKAEELISCKFVYSVLEEIQLFNDRRAVYVILQMEIT